MTGRDFFLQKMHVENITQHRNSYFTDLMRGQRVLHVGCTDWPVFDVHSNLHLALGASNQFSVLDGCDVDKQGLEVLKSHYSKGKYFVGLETVTDEYDWLLVPEVIEHVPNVALFCESLAKINAKNMIITAPNVEGCNALGFFGNTYPHHTEEVHPDHNVWYSPYTLTNAVKRYTGWNVQKTFVINQRRSVGVILSK